jgi:hypothetical protein
MARIINGQPADTPEQKRKILGVKYSENIEGDYIEGKERVGAIALKLSK